MKHIGRTPDSATPSTSSGPPSPASPDHRIDEVWREERAYLVAMASQMLHRRTDAEDVVQEAFSRLTRVELDEIEDPRGWLMVVVRHLCLDAMKSAYTRREAPGWLPEAGHAQLAGGQGALPAPGQAGGDPADRVTLDDEVRFALTLVLERLTPAERTSFVLHDVFGFAFAEIADLVGRTPAACRQLASRARVSIRSGPSSDRPVVEITQQRLVAERFIAACAGGDLTHLMEVLDPDVVGEATLEGRGPFVVLEGRDAVANRILELFGPDTSRLLMPFPLEGVPGILALDQGRVLAVFRMDERGGLIHHFQGVVRAAPGDPRA